MFLAGEAWIVAVIVSKMWLLVLDLMSEKSLWSIKKSSFGTSFLLFSPIEQNVPFASQLGEIQQNNVKIIIFLFSPFKSPPEGVWKIDPEVKNGPLGQIQKNLTKLLNF